MKRLFIPLAVSLTLIWTGTALAVPILTFSASATSLAASNVATDTGVFFYGLGLDQLTASGTLQDGSYTNVNVDIPLMLDFVVENDAGVYSGGFRTYGYFEDASGVAFNWEEDVMVDPGPAVIDAQGIWHWTGVDYLAFASLPGCFTAGDPPFGWNFRIDMGIDAANGVLTSFTMTQVATPEPGTLVLALTGVAGLLGSRLRRSKRTA